MTSRTLTVALMLESDGPGGAEVVVREMARELRRKGHRVLPIGPENGQGWLGQQLRAGLGAGYRFCSARMCRMIFHRSVLEIWGA